MKVRTGFRRVERSETGGSFSLRTQFLSAGTATKSYRSTLTADVGVASQKQTQCFTITTRGALYCLGLHFPIPRYELVHCLAPALMRCNLLSGTTGKTCGVEIRLLDCHAAKMQGTRALAEEGSTKDLAGQRGERRGKIKNKKNLLRAKMDGRVESIRENQILVL